MTTALTGIGVNRGLVIGRAHIFHSMQPEVVEYAIPQQYLDEEVERYQHALNRAKQELDSIRGHIPSSAPTEVAAFIDTHMLMLEDSALSKVPVDYIRDHQCNAEWALKYQRDALVTVFEEMEDPYLRTRRDDVDHVVNRVQRLLSDPDSTGLSETETTLAGRVIIAEDVTPAETILFKSQGVTGFVSEHGGVNSHTAILARSLGLPAIVGVRHLRRYIYHNETIALDSERGMVLADCDEALLQHIESRQKIARRQLARLDAMRDRTAVTLDGVSIKLLANVETDEDIDLMHDAGSDGIGLYRTEMLFMIANGVPTEEQQYQTYRRIVEKANGAPVTIRTLDLGADKQVDGVGRAGPIATNPALGLRAIRLCLKDPTLFYPQLRAILRASVYGKLRIMLPMLTNVEEMLQALQFIEDVKRELRSSNVPFDDDVEIGGMVEVPAAALDAEAFLRHLDFLSIGTNDLIQYTLAADRLDEEVNHLYKPGHPAVLKLVGMTIKAGLKMDKPVTMCGEMAGDVRYVRLLLGMGLRTFSMNPRACLDVRRVVVNSSASELSASMHSVHKASTSNEIEELLDRINQGI